jgi:hypothetical protein
VLDTEVFDCVLLIEACPTAAGSTCWRDGANRALSSLMVEESPDMRLVVYTPVDAESAQKVRLCTASGAHGRPRAAQSCVYPAGLGIARRADQRTKAR